MFHSSKKDLFYAARQGDLEDMKLCLDNGVDINCMVDRSTPLIEAVCEGHTDCVLFLLSKNPQVDKRNGQDCTALMAAAAAGFIDITKALLAAGANPELYGRTKEKKQLRAYDFAVANGHDMVVKIIEDAMKQRNTPLAERPNASEGLKDTFDVCAETSNANAAPAVPKTEKPTPPAL